MAFGGSQFVQQPQFQQGGRSMVQPGVSYTPQAPGKQSPLSPLLGVASTIAGLTGNVPLAAGLGAGSQLASGDLGGAAQQASVAAGGGTQQGTSDPGGSPDNGAAQQSPPQTDQPKEEPSVGLAQPDLNNIQQHLYQMFAQDPYLFMRMYLSGQLPMPMQQLGQQGPTQ